LPHQHESAVIRNLKAIGQCVQVGHVEQAHAAAEAAANLVNARALENGLLCIMLAPMIIKFLVYFGLYYTLKKDRIAAGEDQVLLLTDLPRKDSELGAAAPEASVAAGANSAAAAAQQIALSGRPVSAELRRKPRGLNRQLSGDGQKVQRSTISEVQLADGRTQSLGSLQTPGNRKRGSLDVIDRFLDLEMAVPVTPSKKVASTSKPDK